MMFVSPHLKFDPTRPLSPMVEPLCNLRMEITAEVNLHAFDAGQFWTYPLARRGEYGMVGIRLTPGKDLKDSPVVEVVGAQGLTLASSTASLVPICLWERVRGGGASWRNLSRQPAKVWDDLIAFHHTLGGTGELEAVRALLRDRSIKAACEKGAGDYPGLVAACFEAQQRMDPAPETAVYASYMTNAVRARAAPPVPEAGCWNDALIAFAVAMKAKNADGLRWRLMGQLPGLDADRLPFSLIPGLQVAKAAPMLRSAARSLCKRPNPAWTTDPLWPAVEAISSARKYDGVAHLDVARSLEASGEFAAAFKALAASAWWDTAAHETATREVLEPARALARRAGWAQIADSLDEMVEVRREAREELGLEPLP